MYEAWRISFQSSEQAARFAYKNMEEWQTRLARAIDLVKEMDKQERSEGWNDSTRQEIATVLEWEYQLPGW